MVYCAWRGISVSKIQKKKVARVLMATCKPVAEDRYALEDILEVLENMEKEHLLTTAGYVFRRVHFAAPIDSKVFLYSDATPIGSVNEQAMMNQRYLVDEIITSKNGERVGQIATVRVTRLGDVFLAIHQG